MFEGGLQKMVKVMCGDRELYFDGYERRELDAEYHKTTKLNDDTVIIIIGREGCGKSVKAFQVAKYLDPTFNLDRVCFTAEGYHKACLSSTKHQAVVFDEAFRGMGSSRAASKLNNKLKQIGQEMRQRNLFHIIVLPSLFLLERYWGLHRADLMYYIYANRDDHRQYHKGYMRLYDNDGIRQCFIFGEKTKYIPNKFYLSKGRFTTAEAIDMKAYAEKKDGAFQHQEITDDKEGIREARKNNTIGMLVRIMRDCFNINYRKIAEQVEMGDTQLREYARRDSVLEKELPLFTPHSAGGVTPHMNGSLSVTSKELLQRVAKSGGKSAIGNIVPYVDSPSSGTINNSHGEKQ